MNRYGLSQRPAVPPYLQVVLPVHQQPVAEHVPHDDKIRLLAVDAHPVHSQELGQQRAAVALHDVLKAEKAGILNHVHADLSHLA